MIHDAISAWRRTFFAWGIIFILGFLLILVDAFQVFIHWIPLAILGFIASKDAVRLSGKSPLAIIAFWLVVVGLTITLTGLVFTGTIPYPAFIPLWGLAVLGWLGLAHVIFGFWMRNKSFALIGALWMITSSIMWTMPINPDHEVVVLAFATGLPYLIAGALLKRAPVVVAEPERPVDHIENAET